MKSHIYEATLTNDRNRECIGIRPKGLGLGVLIHCAFPGVSGTFKCPFDVLTGGCMVPFCLFPVANCLAERRRGRDCLSESEPEVVTSADLVTRPGCEGER
jgi:hypothetical protein